MKTKPYIFLLVLVALLIFILGVRYGQKVEKTNKTINYLISLPPTRPPTPTVSMKLITYVHRPCGISFMVPAWFTKENESSTSAQFAEDKKTRLFFSCSPVPVPSSAVPIEKNVAFFQKKNASTRQSVSFAADASISKLIEMTFEFISPAPSPPLTDR